MTLLGRDGLVDVGCDGDGGGSQSAMQVIAAEMENRLRESVGCREGHELPVV